MVGGDPFGSLSGAGVVFCVHVGEGVFGTGPDVAAGVPGRRMPGQHEADDLALAGRQREVDGGRDAALFRAGGR